NEAWHVPPRRRISRLVGPAPDRAGLALQRRRMVGDVLTDEARDEVVAVVVAGPQVERERMAGPLAGLAQRLRPQLFDELVVLALVHQDGQAFGRRLHQLGGVVRLPGLLILAEIGAKRLLSPGHAGGRGDGSERRDAAVAAGLAQRDGEGPVAAHRVPEDRSLLRDG